MSDQYRHNQILIDVRKYLKQHNYGHARAIQRTLPGTTFAEVRLALLLWCEWG